MSPFSLKLLRKGTPAPSPPLSPTYDARFGTSTDSATGWITFALKSGCRRVWLNAARADDSGDGLSAATAKKTFAAAVSAFSSGFTRGDQIMIAQGGTYTDAAGGGDFTTLYGFSGTYPTAILSYDPADPTNAALYGRATGTNQPIVSLTTTGCTFSMSGEITADVEGRIVFQGILFKAATAQAGCTISYNYRKSYIAFQNCRFDAVRVVVQNIDSVVGGVAAIHVSKCAAWGQWTTTGNSSWMYLFKTDGFYCQDNIVVHAGWKLGVSRDADPSVGGPATLGHGIYFHNTNINGKFDRNVWVDSAADGLNSRGGSNNTVNVMIDEPITMATGGWSGDFSGATSGVTVTHNDVLVMGGADINTSLPRGYGPGFTNTLSGSRITNIALFDNPESGDNYTFAVDCEFDAMIDSYALVQNARAYNYSTLALSGAQSRPAKSFITIENSVLDAAVSATVYNTITATNVPRVNTTLTNVTVHAGATTYPLAKTRKQVVEAVMGTTYGSWVLAKAALVNAMLFRPDLPWAQALTDVGLPSLGLTPTYAAATVPSGYGTPTVIY